MRKISFALLSLVAALGSCTTPETSGERTENPGDRPHFYGVGTLPETRGVAQRNKLWYPGSEITVKFLEDPYNASETIREWASEWEEYAGITFLFVDEGERADVRIAFDHYPRYVTWSYTGTDCKYIRDQTEPTANFDFWEYYPEDVRRGDVLRIFGQILGLELEYRHLDFDPGWTMESLVQNYWANNVGDIEWEEIREYVFDPLRASNVVETDEYDAESIMVWPFDRRVSINGAGSYNYELSEQDKEFIGTVYPKEKEPELGQLLMTLVTEGNQEWLNLPVQLTSPVTVDWGDGDWQTIEWEGPGYYNLDHIYDDNREWTFDVYGEADAIEWLMIEADSYLNGILVYTETDIKTIYADNMQTLNVSYNPFIKEIYFNGRDSYDDQYVNVENCSALERLELYGFSIFETDIRNPKLKYVSLISCSGMNDITIADSPELTDVVIYGNNELEGIMIYNCPKLEKLQLDNNGYSINGDLASLAIWDVPMIYENKETVVKIAESLPEREEGNPGRWSRYSFPEEWVAEILTGKNWQLRIGW